MKPKRSLRKRYAIQKNILYVVSQLTVNAQFRSQGHLCSLTWSLVCLVYMYVNISYPEYGLKSYSDTYYEEVLTLCDQLVHFQYNKKQNKKKKKKKKKQKKNNKKKKKKKNFYFCLETPKRLIGKQCRPRSEAAECGV